MPEGDNLQSVPVLSTCPTMLAEHHTDRYNKNPSPHKLNSISLSVLNKRVSLITVWSRSLLLMKKLSSLHISIPVNSGDWRRIGAKLKSCALTLQRFHTLPRCLRENVCRSPSFTCICKHTHDNTDVHKIYRNPH